MSVNHTFHQAIDYRIYRINKTSQLYDKNVERKIVRMEKDLEIYMNTQNFNPTDKETILSYFPTLKSAYHVNGVY